MTAELQCSEPGTHGMRRIAGAQIKNAVEALGGGVLSDARVHEARKELKKARATLRLLRPVLGRSVYARENTTLRDAARPLSRIRAGKVLLDSLDLVMKRFGAVARAVPTDGLRRVLQRERTRARQETLQGTTRLATQRQSLQKAQERAARWAVGDHGWSVVGAGLTRVYSRGRKALRRAEEDRTPANLHEWRKQVKYLWHQLQALQPLWPGLVGELADQAHQLSDYLGDDHDLSLLRSTVLYNKASFPAAGSRGALLALIDRLSTELRDKAMVLGRRLYEEKPSAFEARFGRYWHDWQRRR
jgi:CHAD domain-containing protein